MPGLPGTATPEQKQLELAVRRIMAWAELLLALLRTRESPDIRMKSLLSPDSEHGRTFIALVDDLIQAVRREAVRARLPGHLRADPARRTRPGTGPAVRACAST